ncbi:MAG: hypothetical protein QOH58_110 [Thermoleophilaceae bacterium]|nr:hypothetical protein [Thermoleophilaceae bacterium]
MRADAARNLERIVEAAAAAFAEHGLEASTAEIAQRAGVGEATLFRRFPSKDDLIDAVIAARMDEVLELLAEAVADPEPGAALERWLYSTVERVARDQGFLEAVKERCFVNDAFAERRRRSLELIGQLLRRAQAAGSIREDLAAQDLSFLIGAGAYPAMVPLPGLREDLWKRYLGLIVDGMRPEGATRLRPGPPPRRLLERPSRSDA